MVLVLMDLTHESDVEQQIAVNLVVSLRTARQQNHVPQFLMSPGRITKKQLQKKEFNGFPGL